ncbi:hypothetical protein NE237_014270 [Protea cynaroides]|uniref:Uncharacterized protein n=1 Tax=Protea cynaroides TaxID=273540 RepID=A0A9Q0JRA1_9MAGN|nr:hypothetical protein NE237_014270 [Protea cynaroides]
MPKVPPKFVRPPISDDHKIPVCGAAHLHSGSKDGWSCVTTKLNPSSGPDLTSRSAAVPIPSKTPTMGSVRSFWKKLEAIGFWSIQNLPCERYGGLWKLLCCIILCIDMLHKTRLFSTETKDEGCGG